MGKVTVMHRSIVIPVRIIVVAYKLKHNIDDPKRFWNAVLSNVGAAVETEETKFNFEDLLSRKAKRGPGLSCSDIVGAFGVQQGDCLSVRLRRQTSRDPS